MEGGGEGEGGAPQDYNHGQYNSHEMLHAFAPPLGYLFSSNLAKLLNFEGKTVVLTN
jgi:hypothetical protein